jgi:hypothetical protein
MLLRRVTEHVTDQKRMLAPKQTHIAIVAMTVFLQTVYNVEIFIKFINWGVRVKARVNPRSTAQEG